MTRDEAIKGLLDAAVYLRQEADGCINTQFTVDVYRWTDSIMEAVKLLKEQESRVLTLEEVEDALDTVVWEDEKGSSNSSEHYALIESYSRTRNAEKVMLRFIGSIFPVSGMYSTYGKNWRLWSARPTDEQREAIPWET